MALDPLESRHFPYVPVTVAVRDRTATVEALLDTGFDSELAVPPTAVTDDSPPDAFLTYALADGSRVRAAIYRGTLQLGRFPSRPVDVTVISDEPILGRGVSDHYRVTLDHGSRLTIEP